MSPSLTLSRDIPVPSIKRGRKKGSNSFDNEALVRQAAIAIADGRYPSIYAAIEALKSEFRTNSQQADSIKRMFRERIRFELKSMKIRT